MWLPRQPRKIPPQLSSPVLEIRLPRNPHSNGRAKMARTLECSDEELPDLAVILKNSKLASCRERGSMSTYSGTTKLDEGELESDDEPRSYNGTREKRAREMGESEKNQPMVLEKSPKKSTSRVLKPRSDNPLLRSIGDIDCALAQSLKTPPHTKARRSRKAVEEHKLNATADTDDEELDSDAEPEWDESDGMSDFIVDDNESLEEDDSELEMTPPPPKSSRRLVRGRRRGKGDERDPADLELKMGTLDIEDDNLTDNFEPICGDDTGNFRQNDCYKTGSDVEDPSRQQFSSPEKNHWEHGKDTLFTTPPPSPKVIPRGLTSPKKVQRIPLTPHRPSMDSFWSQEVINDWNDEYSPRKAPKAPPKSLDFQDRSLSDALFPLGKCYAKQDRTKREARKAFSQRKVKLAQQFLTELDETITDGQIEKLAADTGGVKIIWTKTLNTTAGRAKWKRETVRNKNTQPDGKSAISYRHHAAIELAEKVIDDEDRLLNVIAHEFCHLANFMISDISTNPHGKEFKGWAAKCSRHFGDRGIRVTTKHSYIIEYKYAWECTNCGIEYKRHSKSVDPARHQCGTCKGKLVQTKPVPRTTAGKASDYQTFVKENMKKVRDENPGSPQKEIMSLVGKKYQQYKASRKESEGEEERKSLEPISIEEDDGSKEGSPEDESPAVISRKLDFLALSNI